VNERNPYAAPKSDVRDTTETANGKPSAGKRFLWTAAIGFPVFMLTVLFAPRSQWVAGALGSVVLALGCGVVALCIPVRSKLLFVVPSIVAGLVFAYILGTSTR